MTLADSASARRRTVNRALSPVVERFIECAREIKKSIMGKSKAMRRAAPSIT